MAKLPESVPDALGTPMGVGDYVVYVGRSGQSYGTKSMGKLFLGRVVRMTPKGVAIRTVGRSGEWTKNDQGQNVWVFKEWVVEDREKTVSDSSKVIKTTMHSIPPFAFELLENI